jgi:tetratricopeptide (TPR) repeat protein
VKYVERAVAADSTFAWGNFTLFQLYQAANIPDRAEPALRAAMDHMYKLPERLQFIVKVNYYGYVRDPEKQLGVAQMMVELYPDALEARIILADIFTSRNEPRLAIEQMEKILELDPSRTEFVQTLAEFYRELGEFDRAVETHESYVRAHPEDADGYHSLGVAYELEGMFEQAREYYGKTLVLDPDHIRAMCDLADIEGKLSNDEAALEKYEQALARARTPQEKVRIYRSRRAFYSNRGRMRECLEELGLVWKTRESYLPPVAVELEKRGEMVFFVWADRTEEAMSMLEAMEGKIAEPYAGMIPYGYLCVYVVQKDPDRIEPALAQLNQYIEAYNVGYLRDDAACAAGEMEEARGNGQAAIEHYQHKLELDPTDVIMYRSIGRCYRKLGQPEQAIRELEKVLRIYPKHPGTHYQLALAYHDLENQEQAMAHLQLALDRWKDADPVFEKARAARATLAEWQPQSL